MIPRPKPRGFWDYALFAFVLTGALTFLFWLDASDGVGWADVAPAATAAVLSVLVIVLARRAEKATWITQPPWYAYLLIAFAVVGLMFGAMYAGSFLFHRGDITSSRLRHDIVLDVGFTAVTLWFLRRRHPARRHL